MKSVVKMLCVPVLALAAMLATASVSRAAGPKLGIMGVENDGGGIRITQVLEGSVAEQVGLQEDWVIISVNGTFVRGHDEMQEAMDAAKSHLKLVVDTGSGFEQVEADLAKPYGAGKPYSAKNVTHKKLKGPK
jgi:predicted metalloprotease with PDZ domain